MESEIYLNCKNSFLQTLMGDPLLKTLYIRTKYEQILHLFVTVIFFFFSELVNALISVVSLLDIFHLCKFCNVWFMISFDGIYFPCSLFIF